MDKIKQFEEQIARYDIPHVHKLWNDVESYISQVEMDNTQLSIKHNRFVELVAKLHHIEVIQMRLHRRINRYKNKKYGDQTKG